MTPKGQVTKHKLAFIRLKNLYVRGHDSAKATEQMGEIFVNCLSDKGLISRVL